jgi:hypothetical protein
MVRTNMFLVPASSLSYFINANYDDLFRLKYVLISKLQFTQWSFKLADSDDPNILPSEPRSDPPEDEIGYGKPPRRSQFRKGASGCPTGRPKRLPGISIKEILDGDQRGKNGEVISRREAYVIALVNEALRGSQKAFSKFMKLMHSSGLMRREQSTAPTVMHIPTKTMTSEEYEVWKLRNFGPPND